MTQDSKFPNRIRYEYEQSKDLRINFAHGVWGGINPQGEIELNFYTESDKIPAFSEQIIAPDGSLGHEMAPFNDDVRTITRNIHSRIVLNYQCARAVLEWLEDKIDTLEIDDETASLLLDGNGSIEQ